MAEDLVILPGGKFDLDDVRSWLDRKHEVIEDPHYDIRFADGRYLVRYFICDRPAAAIAYYERRLEAPHRLWGSCVTVYLAADEVVVVQEERSGTEEHHVALQFLDWLVPRFSCRVVNNRYDGKGNGRDYTSDVRVHGAGVLYSEDVRTMTSPWAGTLIPIGFYWELDHGDPGGPGLKITRQSKAGPDDEALARYLEAGAMLHRVDEPTRDMLDPAAPELPPPHTLTDGLYLWPADLPYYLRRYHVWLPRAFVLRAKDHGWTVPPVDVAALPPFTPYRDPADFEEA